MLGCHLGSDLSISGFSISASYGLFILGLRSGDPWAPSGPQVHFGLHSFKNTGNVIRYLDFGLALRNRTADSTGHVFLSGSCRMDLSSGWMPPRDRYLLYSLTRSLHSHCLVCVACLASLL